MLWPCSRRKNSSSRIRRYTLKRIVLRVKMKNQRKKRKRKIKMTKKIF
jgi:hypothetical protein